MVCSRRYAALICLGDAREEHNAGDGADEIAVRGVHEHHSDPAVGTRVSLRDAAEPPPCRRRIIALEDDYVANAETALGAGPLTPGLESV